MSKSKQSAAPATAKDVTSIVLPQFPRSDDAKVQRSRWIQDYDRVQSELLRNHLTDVSGPGGTSNSTTVSLRQLPLDWEEQLRQQQAQKAQLEAMRQRALEKKRKDRRAHASLAANNMSTASASSPSRSMAANSPSYYQSGPKQNGANDSWKSASGDAASAGRRRTSSIPAKGRAHTADLYSANQSTIKKDLLSSEGGGGVELSPSARARSRLATSYSALSPIRPTTANTSAPATSYSRLTLSPTRARESGMVVNESVTTTFTASRLPTTQECARIVNHLMLPPANFKKSVQPDLKHIDLRWIRRYKPGGQVGCDLTLDSMREDIFTAPSVGTSALNSPRSVIVLLRNGCTVEDVQARPMEYFRSGKHKANTAHHSSSLALGPSSHSLEMNEEMAVMAQRHYEDRRVQLLGSLRVEYRNLCREVSLLDLVETAYHIRAADKGSDGEAEAAEEVTFLKERKERLVFRRALELEQLAKQQALAEQIRKKVAEGDEKRFLADLEHKRLIEARREAAFARQREAETRQEQLRQQTERLNEEYQDKLTERRHRLEAKEQRMQENRLAHREDVRRMAQQKAAKREARMERQKELQEDLVQQMMDKRAEQDEAEAQRKANQEREMQIHRDQIAANQRLAQERRLESKRAAEAHEDEIRARALEKSELAAHKLQEFHVRQRQSRAEAAAEEARKDEQRKRAFETAAERQEERRDAFVAKRSAFDQQSAEIDAVRKKEAAKQQEREREVEDDKRLYVKRRTQAVQFDQLMSIANIERKRQKGAAVSAQRDKIIDMTLREREAIRLQREKHDEELYRRTVANAI